MKSFWVWFNILVVGFSWGSPPTALPLTSAEQANGFYERGKAAEERGELEVAKICYDLALRALPSHREASEKANFMNRKSADKKVEEGAKAEAGGDLGTANVLYFEALELIPEHPEALKKIDALKKRKGVAFKERNDLLVQAKLQRIIIPRIDFEDNTLGEAIDFLRLRSRELDIFEGDAAKKGVNFIIRKPSAGGGDDPSLRRIKEMRMLNAPLAVALRHICGATRLRYTVENGVVMLSPQDEIVLISRTFKVPPDFVARLIGPEGDPFAARNSRYLRSRFQAYGLSFADDASVVLNEKDELILKGDAALLKRAEELIATLGGRPLGQDGQLAASPKPIPSPAPTGPLVWKSKDGRSVEGEFVGLDGEAVVIKRNGKEFTIPFTRLDPASVKQAKDLANPVVPGVSVAVEDPFAAAAKENPIPPTTPVAPNGSASPVTAGFPAPKHRWSFGGDLRDSLGSAHGTLVDPGDPGAKPAGSMKLYLDGKLAATTSLFAGFLESFNDNNCWLGRGFAGNPFFSGIYNEFRIYDKALSAEQVLASFRAGPDAVIPAAGPATP